MTLIVEQQLQAARHAAADVRDEFQIGGLPLLSDELLHLLHCLREASVDAGLEHVPQVLDGVEVRAPGWPVDQCNSLLVQIGDSLGSGVEADVVLLEMPRASRVELTEGREETVA